MVLDGKHIYEEELLALQEERKQFGHLGVAAILLGESAASEAFIRQKQRAADALDIRFRVHRLNISASREAMRRAIQQIVKPDTVHGAILQLPPPAGVNAGYLVNAIPWRKDIDCLTTTNGGRYYADRAAIEPPAVGALRMIRKRHPFAVEGKTALVFGYGRLIGQPVLHYLRGEEATVIGQSYTDPDAARFIAEADIIVSGAGKPHLITRCKQGAIVIDFGYDREGGKITGDVDVARVRDAAALVTPTPGGTGPLVVAALYRNLFRLLRQ